MNSVEILEWFIKDLTKEIDFSKNELISGKLEYEHYKYICGYISGLDKAYLILADINKKVRDSSDIKR